MHIYSWCIGNGQPQTNVIAGNRDDDSMNKSLAAEKRPLNWTNERMAGWTNNM